MITKQESVARLMTWTEISSFNDQEILTITNSRDAMISNKRRTVIIYDLNGRGLFRTLGHPFRLGLNFTAKWRNFTLCMADGFYGGHGFKDDSYYWVIAITNTQLL